MNTFTMPEYGPDGEIELTENTDYELIRDRTRFRDQCEGCKRGIPEFAFTMESAINVHLIEVDENGTQCGADPLSYCGDCMREAMDFVQDTAQVDDCERIEGEFKFDLPDRCGLCSDKMPDNPDENSLAIELWYNEPHEKDGFGTTAVCPSCNPVIRTFFENVPDEQPDPPAEYPELDQVYLPPELVDDPVRTDPATVDEDEILTTLGRLDADQTVELEVFLKPENIRAGDYWTPAEYFTLTARVEAPNEHSIDDDRIPTRSDSEVELTAITCPQGFIVEPIECDGYMMRYEPGAPPYLYYGLYLYGHEPAMGRHGKLGLVTAINPVSSDTVGEQCRSSEERGS